MKDCVNCKNKNWLRIINKPVMECFITKEQFTVLESGAKSENCPHYEHEEKHERT